MMKNMLKLASILVLVLTVQMTFAQKVPGLDKSPADIAYLRADGETIAKVVYSRPMMNDRTIFGKLVKYDKVWRTGANEATEIHFYRDVKLAGEPVEAGTYTLFTIPGKEEWTIILNSQLDQWGAYRYKEDSDVLRVSVPSSESLEPIEAMAIFFDKKDGKNNLYIGWENTLVAVPVE